MFTLTFHIEIEHYFEKKKGGGGDATMQYVTVTCFADLVEDNAFKKSGAQPL